MPPDLLSTVELAHAVRRIMKLKENVLAYLSLSAFHIESYLASRERIVRELLGIRCFKEWLVHMSC